MSEYMESTAPHIEIPSFDRANPIISNENEDVDNKKVLYPKNYLGRNSEVPLPQQTSYQGTSFRRNFVRKIAPSKLKNLKSLDTASLQTQSERNSYHKQTLDLIYRTAWYAYQVGSFYLIHYPPLTDLSQLTNDGLQPDAVSPVKKVGSLGDLSL